MLMLDQRQKKKLKTGMPLMPWSSYRKQLKEYDDKISADKRTHWKWVWKVESLRHNLKTPADTEVAQTESNAAAGLPQNLKRCTKPPLMQVRLLSQAEVPGAGPQDHSDTVTRCWLWRSKRRQQNNKFSFIILKARLEISWGTEKVVQYWRTLSNDQG